MPSPVIAASCDTHTHTHIQYIHTYIHTYTNTRTHVHTYTHTNTHKHTQTHTHTHTCSRSWVKVRRGVCLCLQRELAHACIQARAHAFPLSSLLSLPPHPLLFLPWTASAPGCPRQSLRLLGLPRSREHLLCRHACVMKRRAYGHAQIRILDCCCPSACVVPRLTQRPVAFTSVGNTVRPANKHISARAFTSCYLLPPAAAGCQLNS